MKPSPAWITECMEQFQTLYTEEEAMESRSEYGQLNEGSVRNALQRLLMWIYHDPQNPHDPNLHHPHERHR